MTWPELIVAHLLASRRAGMPDHAAAWAAAIAAYPPPLRDLESGARTLFDPPGDSLAAFLERVTADAWYGRRPKLRYFQPDAIRVARDRDAVRVRLPAA